MNKDIINNLLHDFKFQGEFFQEKKFDNLKKVSIIITEVRLLDIFSSREYGVEITIVNHVRRYFYHKMCENSYTKDSIEYYNTINNTTYDLSAIVENKRKYCIMNDRILNIICMSDSYRYTSNNHSSCGEYVDMKIYNIPNIESEVNMFDRIDYTLNFIGHEIELLGDGKMKITLDFEYFFEVINPYNIFYDRVGSSLNKKFIIMNREFTVNDLLK